MPDRPAACGGGEGAQLEPRGAILDRIVDLIALPRRLLPARLYLWLCERLYREAAFLYEPVAAFVSGGRWRGWGEAAARGLRGRVLEVGPGPGRVLAYLHGRGVPAIAVELSPAMARCAARLAPGAVLRADARAIPLRDGCADAVLLVFPAPYALEADFWAEARRVLKPGGRMRLLLGVGEGTARRIAHPGWRVRQAPRWEGDARLLFLLARPQA